MDLLYSMCLLASVLCSICVRRTECGGGERVLVAEELAEDFERVAEVERMLPARLSRARAAAEAEAAEATEAAEAGERVDEERTLRAAEPRERVAARADARAAPCARAHLLVRFGLVVGAAVLHETLLPVPVVDFALLFCIQHISTLV